MANIKLGGTTAISESSGAITVPALGTVTSGNISNSAIVYPSGHCIQCKQHTTDTEVSGNATSWEDAFVCPSFTPVSSTSRITIMCTSTLRSYVTAAWNETVAHVRIYDSTNSSELCRGGNAFRYGTGRTNDMWTPVAMTGHQLSSVGSGAARVYKIQGSVPSATYYEWYLPSHNLYSSNYNSDLKVTILEHVV